MLSSQLVEILRVYWRLAKPGRWLFLWRDGCGPIHPQTLDRLSSSLRVPGRREARDGATLRHSFATRLFGGRHGHIRGIQVLLGHRSLATMTLFAQISTAVIGPTASSDQFHTLRRSAG